MKKEWNAGLYDHQFDFVSEYGKGVVGLLNPRRGESILDLGCGTGDLAYEIASSGASVVGMDLSAEMIELARKKYPKISFFEKNAENFSFGEQRFDAVFSNAALHWMKQPADVIRSVHGVLREGGRFVAEFGGKGNVHKVVTAISRVLADYYDRDADRLNPWYYPSIGEYSSLLERQGFKVVYAVHFARPTRMKDGERGLEHWIEAFGGVFFEHMPLAEKQEAVQKITERLRPDLFRDGSWVIDYERLRVMAVKEGQS